MLIGYLYLLFFEIALGGGGKLFAYSFFSLRYFLFFISVFLTLILFKKIKVIKGEFFLFTFGISFVFLGLFSGLFRHNDLKLIIFDVQPFLYFIVFFLLISRIFETSKTLEVFKKMTILSALIMSSVYILLQFLFKFGLLSSMSFYTIFATSSEIFFRGLDGVFFYKGFYFIAIGAIFSIFYKKYFLFIFFILAIFLNETRGLLISTLFVSIIIYYFNSSRTYKVFLISLLPFILIGGYTVVNFVLGLREDVGESDSARFDAINYVLDSSTPMTALFGNGWGSLIYNRERIEIVFIEIFYKTGFLGLISSLSFLIYAFIRAVDSNFRNVYFFIVLFMYLVSLTNPFVFTPMGIVTLAVCIIGLRKKYEY